MNFSTFALLLLLAADSSEAPAKPEEKSPVARFLEDEKEAQLDKSNGSPPLPKDGFEKLDELRNFYGQKIEGIPGGGGVKEITVGNQRFWLCSRWVGSGTVLQECCVFCERDSRFKALLYVPFQEHLELEHHDSKIVVSKYDESFKRVWPVAFLDLDLCAPAPK